MALILGIIWDFAWWIIGIGVAVCMIVVLWGIIRYSTAQGDPSKAAGARATMFGGAFGVVALPVALIAFRIFFGDVIAPNTGVDASFLEQDCDATLRAQLQARANVTTAAHAVGLIAAIQSSKSECSPTNWMNTPELLDLEGTAGTDVTLVNRCGYVNTVASVDRAANAARTGGFGRVGGAIVIQFAAESDHAAHLTATDQCWIYDPTGGGWYIGKKSA